MGIQHSNDVVPPLWGMFFRNTMHRALLAASGFLVAASFGVIWYGIGKRSAMIILHYNVYFGIDVLGEWWQAYGIPLVGMGIWIVHLILALRFFRLGKQALCEATLTALVFLEGIVCIAASALSIINY